jgi:hypothetical protein
MTAETLLPVLNAPHVHRSFVSNYIVDISLKNIYFVLYINGLQYVHNIHTHIHTHAPHAFVCACVCVCGNLHVHGKTFK